MSGFKAVKISERVYWVGAVDWAIRDFHGYSTPCGSTYNAFLVLGDEPVLIDTVKASFYGEMMARISSVIKPCTVRYVISNHAEMDHSGSLPRVMETIKPDRIFASKAGVKALKAHFGLEEKLQAVESGKKLEISGLGFTFLDTKMLHWPDSMVSYLHGDGVLFSQDGFGMHLASDRLFAGDNDPEILRCEAARYYANILLPYSPLVSGLLKKLPGLGLDIRMIAPDHGPLWRGEQDIARITGLWEKWAEQKMEKKVVIAYDTMWQSTGLMARAVADGVAGENLPVKVMPLSSSHRSDVATELLEAGAFLVGSPTINQNMFPTVADLLCYIRGLKPKNLLAQAFGSFGWGGESIKHVKEELKAMKLTLCAEPLRVQYVPTEDDLEKCRELGTTVARQLAKEAS